MNLPVESIGVSELETALQMFTCKKLFSFLGKDRADMGPRQGLASRDRIYSTLLVGIQYLGLAQLYREKWEAKRWLLASVTGVALLFFASSLLVNLHNLAKICDRLLADKVRWTMGEPIQKFPFPEHAARVLKETGEADIFLPRDGSEH